MATLVEGERAFRPFSANHKTELNKLEDDGYGSTSHVSGPEIPIQTKSQRREYYVRA